MDRSAGTLLFVEDDESIRALASRVLAEEGYVVLAAAHGGEALLLAQRHAKEIDLVVTDVVMPGMSGRELAARLEKMLRETPIMFMSGYGQDAVGDHGVLPAGTLFLPKPFTPEVLAARVREVLDLVR
jgi:CheY-like chemotaxis protein